MFICGFCGGQSEAGQAERLIVTQWRKKTYESKKLAPLAGTNNSRWTRVGVGYEAAEVKKACVLCDVKDAAIPAREDFNVPISKDIASTVKATAASMGV